MSPGQVAVIVVGQQKITPPPGKTVAITRQRPSAPWNTELIVLVDLQGQMSLLDTRNRLTLFLDLARAREGFYHSANEEGLIATALHPGYATPRSKGYGKIYTVHTERANSAEFAPRVPVLGAGFGVPHHYDVLMEWSASDGGLNTINPSSGRELFAIAQPLPDNNVGHIAFNPNAKPDDADYEMLYVGVGVGGDTVPAYGYADALRTAQELDSPLGKILRIGPSPAANQPYRVPVDNPFVGRTGALPEIWALGFRKPRWFSWDTDGSAHVYHGQWTVPY